MFEGLPKRGLIKGRPGKISRKTGRIVDSIRHVDGYVKSQLKR